MASSVTPLIVLGEVRTCLLPTSLALNRVEVNELLALVPGRRVPYRERPVELAISPTTAIGVDCELMTGSLGEARVVGTIAASAIVVGGRILQSSARAQVVRASDRRRQSWSHYLSRVGVTELISKVGDRASASDDLAASYLADLSTHDTLDLASITERLLGGIRLNPLLDQNSPIRATSTRLRWIATVGGAVGPQLSLRLGSQSVRTLRLIVREEADLAAAQRFCEDLAVHDWLLTVIRAAIAEADRFAPASPEHTDKLKPVLKHLVPLWFPGAHTPASLGSLWRLLQSDPGFSRQWTTLVEHIRDRLAMSILEALQPPTTIDATEFVATE